MGGESVWGKLDELLISMVKEWYLRRWDLKEGLCVVEI